MGSAVLSPAVLNYLLHPIRKHGYDHIRLRGVIGGQVQTEIMQTAHIPVHRIFHGDKSALTWLENHRTDGCVRRSTPLNEFDIRVIGKPQRLIPDIGHLHPGSDHRPQLDFAIVDPLLVYSQRWRAGYSRCRFTTPLDCQCNPGSQNHHPRQRQPQWPAGGLFACRFFNLELMVLPPNPTGMYTDTAPGCEFVRS